LRGKNKRQVLPGRAKTSLTSLSGNFVKSPRHKKKERPSFEELMAKYEIKGAVQKLKSRPHSTRDANSPLRHRGQQGSHQQRGNCDAALYPFVGSNMPLSWPYLGYYTSSDYNSMYMRPYIISYPNYGALQQPIACNSNLVKGNACTNIK